VPLWMHSCVRVRASVLVVMHVQHACSVGKPVKGLTASCGYFAVSPSGQKGQTYPIDVQVGGHLLLEDKPLLHSPEGCISNLNSCGLAVLVHVQQGWAVVIFKDHVFC
jgi:hypothetical protein